MTDVKLLLIDDDKEARDGIASQLYKLARFEINPFERGKEAIEHLFESNHYEYTAVLLDYVLDSDYSGSRVMNELRENFPQLPIIVFSGNNRLEGQRAFADGAGFLERPINYSQLITMTRGLVQANKHLEIYHEIVEEVRELLSDELCMIWKYNAPSNNFTMQAVSADLNHVSNFTQPNMKVSGKQLSISGSETKPRRFNRTLVDRELTEIVNKITLSKFKWQSATIFPLIYNSGLLGYIHSLSSKPIEEVEDFLDRFLIAYAHRVATSIHNIERSKVLQEITSNTQVVASSINYETTLEIILSKTARQLELDQIAFYKKMSSNNMYKPFELNGYYPKDRETEVSLLEPHPIVLQADELVESRSHIDTNLLRNNPSEMVSMVVRNGNQTVGVLYAIKNPKILDYDASLLLQTSFQIAALVSRNVFIETIGELTTQLANADYPTLTQRIVDLATSLIGEPCIFWVPKKISDGRNFVLKIETATQRFAPEYCKRYRTRYISLDNDFDVFTQGYKTGEPLVVPDIKRSENTTFHDEEAQKSYGWHSIITVPLRNSEGRKFGILSAYSEFTDRFQYFEREALEVFANHASIALEQYHQNRTLQRLAEISEELVAGTITNPPILKSNFLDLITKFACELFDADCAVLFPFDPSRNRYYQPEMIGINGLENSNFAEPRDEGLADSIKSTGDIVIFNIDEQNFESISEKTSKEHRANITRLINNNQLFDDEDIKTFVGIPLIEQSKPDGKSETTNLGILYIDFRASRIFTKKEIEIAHIFGRQVSSIIESAFLMLERKQAQSQLETFLNAVLGENLEEIGERFLVFISENITCNKASLQLVSVKANYRYLIARHGFSAVEDEVEALRPISEDPLIQRVIRSNHGVVIRNTIDEPDWSPLPHTQDVMSWIGIPLRHDNNIYGLLTIDHNEPNFYSDKDKMFLQPYVRQITIALMNAEHKRDATKRQRDLVTLHNIGRKSIRDVIEQSKILEVIVKQIREELACSHCAYFKVINDHDESINFRLLYADSEDSKRVPQRIFSKYADQKSVVGWVYKEQKSVVLENATGDNRFAKPRSTGTQRSLLVVPVWVRGEIVGIISADKDKYNWFQENDRLFVEVLCQQVGIALERSRLFEELKQVSQQILKLHNVSEVRPILTTIVEGATRVLNKFAAVIYLIKIEGENYELVDEYASKHFNVPKPRLKHNDKDSLTLELLTNKDLDIITLEDTRTGSINGKKANPELVKRANILSLLGTSFNIGYNQVCAIFVHHTSVHDYTEIEQEILKILASQAAIAIQNTRIHAELKRRNKDLATAFSEINQAIAVNTGSYDSILESIVKWLSYLFPNAHLIEIKTVNWENRQMNVRASYPPLDKREDTESMSVDDGVTGLVARDRQTVLINDVHKSELFVIFHPSSSITQSELAVPIIVDDSSIGVINIEDTMENAFSIDDADLLETISTLTAVAIKNIDLYNNAEENLNRLIKMNNIGSELAHRMNSLAGTVPTRVERIRERITQGVENNEDILNELNQISFDSQWLMQAAEQVRKETKIAGDFSRVSLEPLIDSIIEETLNTYPEIGKQIKIQKDIEEVTDIYVDEDEIKITFRNLIMNATQAIQRSKRENGLILVKAYQESDTIVVIIQDNGIGIKESESSRIFDMFYSQSSEGLGFGLWRDKQVIEGFGGSISFDSKENKGTKFLIRLPITDQYNGIPDNVQSTNESYINTYKYLTGESKTIESGVNAPNIVLIEDYASWNGLFVDLLNSQEFNIHSYGNYSEFEASLPSQKFPIHCAIVDIRLEENNPMNQQGYDVISKLQEYQADIPIIVVTAHPTLDNLYEAFKEHKVYEYFIKGTDFNSQKFVQAVQNAVQMTRKNYGEATIQTQYRILIIEQDNKIGRSIANVLKRDGYETDQIPDFSQPLENIESYHIMLINISAIDHTIDAIQFYRMLKSRNNRLKIILTAPFEHESLPNMQVAQFMQAKQYGFVENLVIFDQKNADYRRLREIIRQAIAPEAKKYVSAHIQLKDKSRLEVGQIAQMTLQFSDVPKEPMSAPIWLPNRVSRHILKVNFYAPEIDIFIGDSTFWELPDDKNPSPLHVGFSPKASGQKEILVDFHSGDTWLGRLHVKMDISNRQE